MNATNSQISPTIELPAGRGATALAVADIEAIRLPDYVVAVTPCQTHSLNVGIVDEEAIELIFAHQEYAAEINDHKPCPLFPDTDALVTRLKGVAVGVRTADCVPILLDAPDIGAVGAVHAGWKGTLGGIVRNTVALLAEMGADPRLIHATFGPSICGICYETSAEMKRMFEEAGLEMAIVNSDKPDPCGEKIFSQSSVRIDLPAANREMLLACGLPPGNIRMAELCTRHSFYPDSPWPSWRRLPATTRRLASLIFRR